MQAWKGWTATAGVPTWAEWCGRQQGTLRARQRRPLSGVPFTERELARLAFVRWLCNDPVALIQENTTAPEGALAGHAVPQQRSLHSQSTPSATAAVHG
jgi:hypothetical protein